MRKSFLLPLLVIALAALALVPVATPSLQFILTVAIAKGFIALGVAVLLRAGLISFGHAMFYAISAYCIAFLSKAGLVQEFVALLVIGTAGAALAGLLLGAFLMRYRSIFFAMLNLAFSMVLYALASKLYGITGGTDGIHLATPTFFGFALEKQDFDLGLYYAALVLMIVLGYLTHRYWRSPLGHALSAIESNELRLEYLGVSAQRVVLIAYVASAALAGIGGVIGASLIGHVLPEYTYWTASGHSVLVAVLGGIGGGAGPFIGSVFLELLHTASVTVTDAWNLIVGAALIVVIFFLPGGLYGLLQRRHSGDAT